MAKEYYLISDLHIGGDGALDACEFETELIDFLRELENNDGDIELVIAGDLLGLWELTTLSGPDKLHAIIASHFELFRQFQHTGAKVPITVIPGNHDYELATDPEFEHILRAYNIHLESKEYITRDLAGRKLWIEHGNQRDDYNRFDFFGHSACKPFGYYVTTNIISNAGQRVRNRHEKWLKDIESVYPTEHIPHWLFSNYFYREMSVYIRALGLPVLLLLAICAVMASGALLELFGLAAPGSFLSSFTHRFGILGYLLDAMFIIGGAILITILLLIPPLMLIRHDLRNVLRRYNFDLSRALSEKKNEEYLSAAEQVFREHPEVAVFIFGHSHIPEVKLMDGHAIVNTGSWAKRLTRIPSRFLLLPDVYYPSYHLGYFRVTEEDGGIALHHHTIEKDVPEPLLWLQQMAIMWKTPEESCPVPPHTLLQPKTEEAG